MKGARPLTIACNKSTLVVHVLAILFCFVALIASLVALIENFAAEWGVLFAVVLVLFALVIHYSSSKCRGYYITEKGITASYFGLFKKHYPWERFVDTGVYSIECPHKVSNKFFVFSTEPFDKIARNYSYLTLNVRSCLWFLYTPEWYGQISAFCPKLTMDEPE